LGNVCFSIGLAEIRADLQMIRDEKPLQKEAPDGMKAVPLIGSVEQE